MVEDRLKADKFLGLAKQFATDNDHATAIQMLSSAFAFTSDDNDYELLALQYVAQNEPLKAILAYLYLAKRKIEEGQALSAVNCLNFARGFALGGGGEILNAARASAEIMGGGSKLSYAASIFRILAKKSNHRG